MRYEWAAIFEKVSIEQTADGEIERLEKIKKAGTIEDEFGQNVVRAVINNTIGNLVWLEVRRA